MDDKKIEERISRLEREILELTRRVNNHINPPKTISSKSDGWYAPDIIIYNNWKEFKMW